MHILVDGYNLIRQSDFLRRFEHKSLEAGRLALMAKLADYKRKKGHRITVVFDGWKGGSMEEERDRHGNIEIIYSRQGERADEVIKRITDQTAEETIVVSSDREIASYATLQGKTALSSLEFEAIMNRAISASGSGIYEKEGREEREVRQRKKKGPARRLPRTKRKAQKKIKKL
ncbi:MAG: NYN domain-containing protein [Smithellaceae bacterium]|jgi:predicted RNA-binding protein with PIN domain